MIQGFPPKPDRVSVLCHKDRFESHVNALQMSCESRREHMPSKCTLQSTVLVTGHRGKADGIQRIWLDEPWKKCWER